MTLASRPSHRAGERVDRVASRFYISGDFADVPERLTGYTDRHFE
jgi:hypothetical protein